MKFLFCEIQINLFEFGFVSKSIWIRVLTWINLNKVYRFLFIAFQTKYHVLTRKILWIDSNLCLDWKIKEIYLNLYFWWEKSSVPIMYLIDDLSCNSSSWKIPKWLTQNNWIFKIANSQFLLLKFHGLVLGLYYWELAILKNDNIFFTS